MWPCILGAYVVSIYNLAYDWGQASKYFGTTIIEPHKNKKKKAGTKMFVKCKIAYILYEYLWCEKKFFLLSDSCYPDIFVNVVTLHNHIHWESRYSTRDATHVGHTTVCWWGACVAHVRNLNIWKFHYLVLRSLYENLHPPNFPLYGMHRTWRKTILAVTQT